MSFVAIIPSRMKSTRLPEKPLKDIGGKPMVVRVAERAAAAGADQVVVATDHKAIFEVCEKHRVKVLMTREDHPTGTDRLSEAVTALNLSDDTIVVNVQGDEPLIPTEVIQTVAQTLVEHPDCAMATAAHTIYDIDSFKNPNVVKVEVNARGEAMTFSRAPLPWPRDQFRKDDQRLPEDFSALHHIGLYAYRASFLKLFPTLERAPIEALESLEQLRAMWHGHKIAVAILKENLPAGVDTEEDLERVRQIWQKNHG